MANEKSFLSRLKRLLLYLNSKYDRLQKSEIILGENKGLDVYFYKKPEFDWMQMREIRLGLEKGLDVSSYAKSDITTEQMEEIRIGLEKGLDVSFFNKSEFDWMQMREVRLGLEKELDVSFYSKSDITTEQMEEIRLGLEKGLDVTFFNKPEFDQKQMREIRLGLEKNLDISFYDNPELDWKQMREIRLGMEQGLNIHEYIQENSFEKMRENRQQQLKENFIETESIIPYSHFKEKITEPEKKVDIENKIKNEKVQMKDEIFSEEDTSSNKFTLSKFDVNMMFPLLKRYNTDELIKKHINETYTSAEYANLTYDIQKKRIEKLIDNEYITVIDGKYHITQKAIEESKEVNKGFEFTSFDSDKVFGYILKAGGALTLKDLKDQLRKEYTDEAYANKQYEYLKNRLEKNFGKGYVMKSKDNSYCISDLGMEKAREIRLEKQEAKEAKLEVEAEI